MMDLLPLFILLALPILMIGIHRLIIHFAVRRDLPDDEEVYILHDSNGKKIKVVIEKGMSSEGRAATIGEMARQLSHRKTG